MELVAIVEPSVADFPGHMVIGQESEVGSRFFGFALDGTLVPEEYREPVHLQEFLYSNKVLGEIRDESSYVERIRRVKSDRIYEKRVKCDVPIDTVIPEFESWKHCAYYSFRPDDFHADADPCYNCVTWVTMIANKLVPGFVAPVRQGQIKLIVRQFKGSGGRKGKRYG